MEVGILPFKDLVNRVSDTWKMKALDGKILGGFRLQKLIWRGWRRDHCFHGICAPPKNQDIRRPSHFMQN